MTYENYKEAKNNKKYATDTHWYYNDGKLYGITATYLKMIEETTPEWLYKVTRELLNEK